MKNLNIISLFIHTHESLFCGRPLIRDQGIPSYIINILLALAIHVFALHSFSKPLYVRSEIQ